MNWMFCSLFPAAIGAFLLIAYLMDRALCACERLYRRRACRREMARWQKVRDECELCKTVLSPHPHVAIREVSTLESQSQSYMVVGNRLYVMEIDRRRQELDALATAQDKQTRRIVH